MCEKLMNNKSLFEKEFLGIMAGLVDDKVVNVKLVLAEIVKQHVDGKGSMSENETLLGLREKLRGDPNEEVSSVFEDS
jgi:hypothetical protein